MTFDYREYKVLARTSQRTQSVSITVLFMHILCVECENYT